MCLRFDLKELQQLCELRREDAAAQGDDEDCMGREENVNNQTDQAFMELLRSMWNEEDEDNEATDTDGGHEEERGVEEDRQADGLTAGDREICEEKVNEEEMEEIYEFAATQRKREEEKDSMEEEEVVEEDGQEVFTKLTEPKRSSTGFSAKNLQINPLMEPDPSLDSSYSRLFSDSWGAYKEGDPSSFPSTSGQPNTHTPQSQKHHLPHKSSSKLTDRALLQCSASIVDDLSLSPPPSISSLPVPGQSPGQGCNWRTDAVDLDLPKEGFLLKKESQGPRTICIALSPDSPQIKKEPELIVLSDSSNEMEAFLSSRSPSPHSPCAVQNRQSYTQIKPQPVPKPNEPTLQDKKSSSLEFSPDHPSAAPDRMCNQSPVDCSPEVSWLIPSTPLQHGRSTMTSSSQTRSSMCRTQLFPKGETPSSSAFSSPALPFNNRLQASNSPTRVSAPVGPTEDGVPRVKLEETAPCSSSFDPNFCHKENSCCDMSEVREVFAAPLSQSKHSRPPSLILSKQDTPLHPQRQPYSSTPLHTELHQPPAPLVTSPLHSNFDKRRPISQGRARRPSESPEKTELGSFRLSSLSDPSDPPSTSPHRALQSSQRHSDSSRQSRRSVEFSPRNNTGSELTRRGIRDEEGGRECENKDTGDEGQQEEATGESGVTESSFRQSFMAMDEPPIAFNDSWGLDVCVDANPGCFSLRLEDSGGSGQHSLGQRETARSSSSTNCQPSPPRHSVRFSNSHGGVTASSPYKAHDSQPSTNAQAHTGPSPPDPTTRTTPEISNSLLDSRIWDSWEEDEEDEALPLSQRVNPSAQLKTPG